MKKPHGKASYQLRLPPILDKWLFIIQEEKALNYSSLSQQQEVWLKKQEAML